MEPFLGTVQIFAFNFAPRGWALCDGQLLPISQYTAVFSLLGTTYGGDGRTSFGLPDLRGRSAVHVGSGPGLSQIRWGEKSGQETATLSVNNMPAHSHAASLNLGAGPGLEGSGDNAYLAGSSAGETIFTTVAPSGAQLASESLSVGSSGGGQSFNLRNPYLGMYHSIALIGLFPSRN